MWTTLALAATLSLAPQQAGQLTLTNVRSSYGPLGVPRKDNKVLPGDRLYIAFDVEGITADQGGKVLYSMLTEVLDSKNKVLFKQDPQDLEAVLALGGKSMPAFVQLDAGLDQPPGEYTIKVVVTDRASKRSAILTRTFQLLPKGFGMVRLLTTHDPEGQVPASVFEAGGALFVNLVVVGFERDKAKKQPRVAVELRVLDEKGQPTFAKPFTGEIGQDVPETALSLPVQFLVSLNRNGKFTVELKATDLLTRKTAETSFPLTVLPSAK